ncbi:hypothetical protein DLREEDagrD3_24700 [Denitratisoma sp. agr-D3]
MCDGRGVCPSREEKEGTDCGLGERHRSDGDIATDAALVLAGPFGRGLAPAAVHLEIAVGFGLGH